jgi:hypothetical protein
MRRQERLASQRLNEREVQRERSPKEGGQGEEGVEAREKEADCWVAKIPSFYQPFTSLSVHFHFSFNHISLSHTLTLNHFHDYMGFRHIIFQCIYFSVFE